MSSRPVSYVRNSRRRWRWSVVALTCISLASSYYVYDLPAALNRPLRSQLNIAHDEWQYWLAGSYATYALPNVFMPFYVPHLMNKLGPRYLFILLALLALIGQLCFTTALLPSTTTTTTTKHNSLLLLLGGRFLLGLGVESLGVAQSSLTCQWFFSSRRLGLALSLNVVMARMGAILNDITSPWIWHQWDSPDHTWMNQLWSWLTRCGIPENWLTGAIMANIIGLVMCMAGLITACIVVFMDYWSEQRYTRNPEISFVVTNNDNNVNNSNSHVNSEQPLLNHRRSTLYGAERNTSATSLNVPLPLHGSQPQLHLPFSSVRRQVSNRDIRSIRHSYFRTDRLNRTSGIYRRYSRPIPGVSRPRQRSSVDSVWVAPPMGHGLSTSSDPSLHEDSYQRQHQRHPSGGDSSIGGNERLTTSADAIIPYSSPGHNHSNSSNITASTNRHWPAHPQGGKRRALQHRSLRNDTTTGNQSNGRDISMATIATTNTITTMSFSCSWQFGLLCSSMICFYSAVIPLVNVASDYFLTRWTTSPIYAGLLMALPDLISTLLVPLGADKCYDRSQQRWTLLWVGCIMTMVHWYLGEGNSDQWHGLGAVVALMTLGLCYGIFSVIFWTALPQILPNMDHHPLAYARMTGLLNLSLVVVPFIVARTIAIDHSFQTTSRLFVVISLLATLTAGCLYATGTLDPAHPVMRADNDDTDQYEGDSDYADDYYNGYWSEEFSDAWESPDEHDDYEDDMRMDYEEDDDNAPNGIYFEPLPSAEAALRNYLPMNSNQSDDSRPRYETA